MATEPTTAAGRWDCWYADTVDASVYGDPTSYQLGAQHLAPCATIEDWGCGKGGLTLFRDATTIRGVDGSPTPWAEIVTDLATYRSSTPGLFMRHVLEHNYTWAAILANAIASFQERLALIVFTPLVETTHEIAFADNPGVPDIAFALDDLLAPFAGSARTRVETIATDTQYGTETLIYAEKPR